MERVTMAVYKCKMCGANLEAAGGSSVCKCEYCGTNQTLPLADSDEVLGIFNRANHFRQQCEFDKAVQIYEKLVGRTDDPELYYSLALCRYGIEYVDDPMTGRKIPTCHRTQYRSILEDADFLTAVENADAPRRAVYMAEGQYIDKVQKGILEISSREQPFDVFICYKETDANGERTEDSVLAQDLYDRLVRDGLKVFFSRITLEDKLGQKYEPYIFSALNSARVMVVLGTKPEHFSAVWVRNEWSRYLMLAREDRSRVIIPAYKDMDPYDLPDELASFQAQDMGKLGWIQDLSRGIEKIVRDSRSARNTAKAASAAPQNSISSLLKRTLMFIEDGDWANASKYSEKVLDLDPENAQGYICKLMAKHQAAKPDDLVNCREDLRDDPDLEKAIRFGDEKIKNRLTEIGTASAYNLGKSQLTRLSQKTKSSDLGQIKDAIIEAQENESLLESLEGYKDSRELFAKAQKVTADLQAREKHLIAMANAQDARDKLAVILSVASLVLAFIVNHAFKIMDANTITEALPYFAGKAAAISVGIIVPFVLSREIGLVRNMVAIIHTAENIMPVIIAVILLAQGASVAAAIIPVIYMVLCLLCVAQVIVNRHDISGGMLFLGCVAAGAIFFGGGMMK